MLFFITVYLIGAIITALVTRIGLRPWEIHASLVGMTLDFFRVKGAWIFILLVVIVLLWPIYVAAWITIFFCLLSWMAIRTVPQETMHYISEKWKHVLQDIRSYNK
jgi:hypothetical protein